jgi:hypothetical protein
MLSFNDQGEKKSVEAYTHAVSVRSREAPAAVVNSESKKYDQLVQQSKFPGRMTSLPTATG